MPAFRAQPIAIVGIAAALPGCGDDLAAFARLLDSRGDMVEQVPKTRRRDAGLDRDVALSAGALLDRIDTFDHAFFGLSRREAQHMDPQQRLLLQLSCQAIWDAGYPLGDFRGSRTAVVIGVASETYSRLIDPATVPLVTGLLPAAQAGRVAHLLDLRGPALAIDTACSSSLAAVNEACRKLATGEADWALTGGVRLLCVPPTATVRGSESILSPGGRARSFDAAADGTGLGEGGAVFLLKPLARAQEDGDPIHAVILGGASNQDGGRSNGFAAPSAEAQEEVLLEAWHTAGIHPNSLGLIEAHGTGTRLGDPIEFQALSAAFARRTDRLHFCTLSSVKSNLGHLDSAAGAAGLLKAVVALKTGRRYASAHFTTPNPLLDVERSALRLDSRTDAWDAPGQRRAGVSAFGLTGTNVHLVLEQAPVAPDRELELGRPLLVPLSARSDGALRRHAGRLAAHLRGSTEPTAFPDLAWVQAAGRDHDRWRADVLAADADEAIVALERLAVDGDRIAHVPDATASILLLAHEGEVTSQTAAAWLDAFPALAPWYASHRQSIAHAEPALQAAAERLLNKLTLVQALVEAGVSDRILMGHGNGNLLVDVVRGECDLLAAARAAELTEVGPPDPVRTEAACASLLSQGELVFLAPWPGQLPELADELAERHRGVLVRFDPAAQRPREVLLDTVATLYRAGATLDWTRGVRFLGGYGRRTWAPTALFDPVRCWVEHPYGADRRVTPVAASAERDSPDRDSVSHLKDGPGTETERTLAAIWCALLGALTVGREDDFFDLGGDSLMQTQLGNAIARDLGVELTFDRVFDHPRLQELAAYIDSLVPAPVVEGDPRPDVVRDHAPATHSQRRMWMLQQLDPDAGTYNVSSAFELDGPVDAQSLRQALDLLVERHGILRTRFALEDVELVQRVEPVGTFDLTVTTLDGPGGDATASLRDHAAQPFDLSQPGAARALLLVDPADSGRGWFQLVLHHAICDEWSMNLLLGELTADYGALRLVASPVFASPVPAPVLQFTEWAVQERALEDGPAHAEDARYWRQRLTGALTELPLPTDFPYGAQQDHRGAWLTLAVPAELVTQARAAARARKGTLFTWLMTGYAAWLARLTQAEDFLIGVPVAGRYHADAERLPGCFINTLPVRVDASGDPSFTVLFDRVRDALVGAYAHQRYPFDLMVGELGAAGASSRPPLVQTLLSLQSSRGDAGHRLGETGLRPLHLDGAVAWLDLSAVLWETTDGGLSGVLAYRTALFEEATIRGFWQDWLGLAEAGIERPDEPIHSLLHADIW